VARSHHERFVQAVERVALGDLTPETVRRLQRAATLLSSVPAGSALAPQPPREQPSFAAAWQELGDARRALVEGSGVGETCRSSSAVPSSRRTAWRAKARCRVPETVLGLAQADEVTVPGGLGRGAGVGQVPLLHRHHHQRQALEVALRLAQLAHGERRAAVER
jgi:hypothetical protein